MKNPFHTLLKGMFSYQGHGFVLFSFISHCSKSQHYHKTSHKIKERHIVSIPADRKYDPENYKRPMESTGDSK